MKAKKAKKSAATKKTSAKGAKKTLTARKGAKKSAIRDARLTKGLSQVQLAAKVGTSQSILSQIENGKMKASENVAKRLSKFLGVSI
jgi:ribosome-binding protein aMBF1 (putative translation factor)